MAAATDSPNDEGVGRGMKVAKEQIVGMVAAVDWFVAQSEDAMQAEFRQRAEFIANRLKDVPTLTSEIAVPEAANHVPHLLMKYDQSKVKITPLEVAHQLRKGTPSIALNPSTGSH